MYGIFAYIWLICMVNVGKYTSPMDPMGNGLYQDHFFTENLRAKGTLAASLGNALFEQLKMNNSFSEWGSKVL